MFHRAYFYSDFTWRITKSKIKKKKEHVSLTTTAAAYHRHLKQECIENEENESDEAW